MFFVISTVQSKGFHCFMHIFGTVLELVVFHGDLDVCFLLEAVTSHPNDNLQFLLLLSSLLLRSLIYDFQSYASGVLWFKLVFPKQILWFLLISKFWKSKSINIFHFLFGSRFNKALEKYHFILSFKLVLLHSIVYFTALIT